MKYYVIYPEVAGELGEKSEIIYESGKIKDVVSLEYVFTGWQGDEILTTHPCFIITENMKNSIIMAKLKGAKIENIKIAFSEEFIELYGKIDVPNFFRIKPTDLYEKNIDNLDNDFYYNRYKDLVISEKALEVIKKHKIDMCLIEEIER